MGATRVRASVFLALLCSAGITAPGARAESDSRYAADAYFDPAEMDRARAALKHAHGGQRQLFVMFDRFEYGAGEGRPASTWEGQAWYGSDLHKLWLKTEGHYASGDDGLEEAELQLLYSRAIAPFWDLQAGVRHDPRPHPARTALALGVLGLAPYWFELDGALFLGETGDLSLRIEIEYDLLLTQRLILQPRIELTAAAGDDAARGYGSGLREGEFGLRLRYEFRREFAPYIGLSWSDDFGETRDLRAEQGDEAADWAVLTGVRIWY